MIKMQNICLFATLYTYDVVKIVIVSNGINAIEFVVYKKSYFN